jgi:hypothetical protein
MADVFGCALPPLLMNEIEVAIGGVLVGIPLKLRSLVDKFVGRGNGVVARVEDVSGSISGEFVMAELEQADIRAGALPGIKVGLNFGNRLHKVVVEAERGGRSFNLLKRRADRNIFQSVQGQIGGFPVGRMFGIHVVSQI